MRPARAATASMRAKVSAIRPRGAARARETLDIEVLLIGAVAAATGSRPRRGSALLHCRGAAVDVLGLVGHLSARDPFAGSRRDEDPGLGIAVGARGAGARALARPAVVLAGLDDAGALLGV